MSRDVIRHSTNVIRRKTMQRFVSRETILSHGTLRISFCNAIYIRVKYMICTPPYTYS